MDLSEIYKVFLSADGVSTDTRNITPNSLFFALKGGNFNGNHFAAQALQSGAMMAIVDEEKYTSQGCILVNDVLSTLQQLSKHHREHVKTKVIGLTGSNGKTTTKELIHAVLSTKYNTLATIGNLNNHIGVPLTLLRLNNDYDFAIIEMGANHQKEIEFLSSLCQPDYGYITNFGKAHLEGFGGIEGVVKGKSELYQYLRQHHKRAFINMDDPIQVDASGSLDAITFGLHNSADYQFQEIEGRSTESTVGIKLMQEKISSRLTGDYNFYNIAVAACMGHYFEVPLKQIKTAIENYDPQNSRSQIKETDHNFLIIDAYNANPSSMEAALESFFRIDKKSKWVILGDMFELGEYSQIEHQKIADFLRSDNFEKVILIGKAFSSTSGPGVRFSSTEEAISYIKNTAPSGKSILLKGSRGMQLERLLPYL